MRIVIAAAALLGLTSPCYASGGISCAIKDKNLTFLAEAGVSRGMGEGIFSFKANLDIHLPGVAEDLRKVDLSDHLTQKWYYGRDIKMRLYRERESEQHGYVELIIETRQKTEDDVDYKGSYVLTVFDVPPGAPGGKTITRRGRAECSGE